MLLVQTGVSVLICLVYLEFVNRLSLSTFIFATSIFRPKRAKQKFKESIEKERRKKWEKLILKRKKMLKKVLRTRGKAFCGREEKEKSRGKRKSVKMSGKGQGSKSRQSDKGSAAYHRLQLQTKKCKKESQQRYLKSKCKSGKARKTK